MKNITPYIPIEPKSHFRTLVRILQVIGWQACLFIIGFCLMIGGAIVMEILIRLNSLWHTYAVIGALIGVVILLIFFISLKFWPPRIRLLSEEELYILQQKWEQENLERSPTSFGKLRTTATEGRKK
ncbi:MAG: hypothetical protein A2Y67_04260 [Candidatus Buchananbacteria bacterium RBG_13_39_9]|uniref:Uncharacterized protein n=1 Tax=Candidatus Buchananbacteria bacterium RBG_13_39_9 TaxID=1797531 RepID=A0A1G1XS07_9BACT|nr:MAG: hypothetical protein A2Y67_04260 [Candidatus Buchananbacteria bacterium RBG_13_39_9]